MVSIDNLNRDVLELAFAHLNADDLCYVTLVNRSFFATATPQLYRTLLFRYKQAAKFPLASPFATILACPSYALHVRAIDIRSIPTVKSIPHPELTRQFAEAVKLCKNLKSFTCMEGFSCFLPYLENITGLSELRATAQLSGNSEQATHLTNFDATLLQSLSLYRGSWNVMSMLPVWTSQRTLTSLVLLLCPSLNDTVLESVLTNSPQLVILHVVRCLKVDATSILRLSHYTPMLRSLGMTFLGPLPHTPQPTVLTHLRELTLDLLGMDDVGGENLTSFVSYLRNWLPPLASIHLRSGDTIPCAPILQLLDHHTTTLTELSCRFPLEVTSIVTICSSCRNLEELSMHFPIQSFTVFATAIQRLQYLHTLNDTRSLPSSPGLHVTRDQVTHLLSSCRRLRHIVSGKRAWTRYIDAQGNLEIKLGTHQSEIQWFFPLR